MNNRDDVSIEPRDWDEFLRRDEEHARFERRREQGYLAPFRSQIQELARKRSMNRTNPYEDDARRKKAIKLADAIAGAGLKSADLLNFNDGVWASAAAHAGTSMPSTETIAMVGDLLRAREEAAKRR